MKLFGKSSRRLLFAGALAFALATPICAHASTDPEPPPPHFTDMTSAVLFALSAVGLF